MEELITENKKLKEQIRALKKVLHWLHEDKKQLENQRDKIKEILKRYIKKHLGSYSPKCFFYILMLIIVISSLSCNYIE